ncbi:helix-turn-helix transcriptional regulator [Pseudoduganella namucuonensis]|uniref:Transcriptional regulator, LuxR family n=1 Tax=Pseudoduganella namucuonensis TaxID=1035707 RepID=A0A1I7LSA1_9BURK|nr:helix-turn-helix transcriptional regulator [Pseudoduganella namucuonensis]SFV12553.1 transcriptional regulator, LuxR family [Pseudoduganella namucuonensis]
MQAPGSPEQTPPAADVMGLAAAHAGGAEAFDRLDTLVGLIYEGALETVPWTSALNMVRAMLDANWVTLTLRPASPSQLGLIVLSGHNGAVLAPDPFLSYYAFAMDPFANLPDGVVLTVDDAIGEEPWMTSEFYHQFVRPHDIRYMAGADIRTAEGVECRFRVCRPPSGSQFSPADKALCRLLLPHLRRSVRMHARLDLITSERELYATTVNSLLVGTVLLDKAGAIIKTNRVADEIFAERDGIELARGAMYANYGTQNRELQRLLKQALEPPAKTKQVPDAISLTRPSGRARLGVLVRRLPPGEWSEGNQGPVAVVFVRDPERKSQASAELMRRLFDLTPAEAALALLLANGLALDEAADELDIRKNTARAQLRSIFSKTGVTRQTALVHVLLNSVISLH